MNSDKLSRFVVGVTLGCIIGWFIPTPTTNQDRLVKQLQEQIEVQQRTIKAQNDTIAIYERMLKK